MSAQQGKWQGESSFFGKKEAKKLLSVGAGFRGAGGFLWPGMSMAWPACEPTIRLGGEAKMTAPDEAPSRHLSPTPTEKVFLLLFVHKKKILPAPCLPASRP